jgi:hypothetical protein
MCCGAAELMLWINRPAGADARGSDRYLDNIAWCVDHIPAQPAIHREGCISLPLWQWLPESFRVWDLGVLSPQENSGPSLTTYSRGNLVGLTFMNPAHGPCGLPQFTSWTSGGSVGLCLDIDPDSPCTGDLFLKKK